MPLSYDLRVMACSVVETGFVSNSGWSTGDLSPPCCAGGEARSGEVAVESADGSSYGTPLH